MYNKGKSKKFFGKVLETKESNYQNLNEEFTYPETNIIYNYKDDFKGEKLSKSLSLRLGPERKYAPFEVKIKDINNNEIIGAFNDNNNINNEIISNRLSLRNCPERKYAPIEIEIKNLNNKEKLKEKITDEDIINFNTYLKELIDGETQIESYKVDLALKQDFNCEDFFRLFEYEGGGFILPEDLNYGLNLLNLESNEEVINLLIKRFDLLKENKLNYGDFFDIIVSFQSSYRNIIEKRIPISKNPENILELLDNKTISSFKILLVSIIDLECRINNLRKKLNLKEDKIKELFNLIDDDKKGFLIYDDLIKYLFKNNINSNNQLGMDLLFIRLDKERKGKLFLVNFLDELRAL